ncbi:DsbA family protein [Pleomorphomonas sp. NRK KF1]|uniref:DsbA family protein n=1 Tax=Pleomorphomonas sp. NRK KF1 TaxID=2943000 RepID=UPI00204392BB|nr:DsbA family protein [Pleomorphomonas sp. NRK KF1]MCM5552882.1 DsbA family protein [Pleomorphomonas sp. NRK KF1]
MQRRTFLAGATATLALGLGSAQALAADVSLDDILHDPNAPEGGNQKGDLTIVAFTDYNCPFCKKAAPDLDRAVREDGHIRLVYKDWPILTQASVYGARMALAAQYQGAYERAHHALMAINGRAVSQEDMERAIEAADIDMPRLKADLEARKKDITALLARNMDQADALGLQGTPTYLIGPLLASTLDYDGFREAIAQARSRQTGDAQ